MGTEQLLSIRFMRVISCNYILEFRVPTLEGHGSQSTFLRKSCVLNNFHTTDSRRPKVTTVLSVLGIAFEVELCNLIIQKRNFLGNNGL
jgi:hypothetical protein